MSRFGYGKELRLIHKNTISSVFREGVVYKKYPLRMYVIPHPFADASHTQFLISVPKRLHRTAVARNHLKRRIKEAMRLLRPSYFEEIPQKYAIVVMYSTTDIHSYQTIQQAVDVVFKKLLSENSSVETPS